MYYKDERRKFDRFEVDFTAEIKPVGRVENDFALCCDVSPEGAGLLTDQELTPDTELEILLGIPDGHAPLRSFGRVIWSQKVQEDKWRSGVEFKSVDFMGIRRVFAAARKQD